MIAEGLEKIVARHEILTEDQVTAVLEGKEVIAPQREIDEVLCAAAVYEAKNLRMSV